MISFKDITSRLRGENRTARVLVNSLWMSVIRFASIGISFLYIPLLLGELNEVRYGIWLTISSLVSWCSLLDVGLGHGLRNRLAEALAQGDMRKSKELVATAYGTMAIVVVAISLIACVAIPLVNWSSALNTTEVAEDELCALMMVTSISFLLTLLFRTMNAILYAVQAPAICSFMEVSSQFFAFIIVYIFSHTSGAYSLLLYGSIISGVPLITQLVFTIILFCTKISTLRFRITDIKLRHTTELMNLGGKFFLLQITALLLFQTNSFILTQCTGPASVTDYSISYRYIGIVHLLFSVMTTPVWSAVTEAYVKDDIVWIERILKSQKRLLIFFALFGIILTLAAPLAYELWLKGAVSSDYVLNSLMLVYFTLSMWCGLHCKIINGVGKIRLQLVATCAEAMIQILLAVALCQLWGVYGVVVAMIVTSMINAVWEPIQVKKILLKSDSGIWSL